ncbi:hypothetical protein [Caproiciproducens sp.]
MTSDLELVSSLDNRAKYKMQIMSDIANDQDIIDILLPNPDSNLEISDQLLGYWDRKVTPNVWHEGIIVPYLYYEQTIQEKRTYVCIDAIPKDIVASNAIQDMYLYINIFTHKSLMKCEKQGFLGTRMDILSQLISNLVTSSNQYGIGKCSMQNMNSYNPDYDYSGYTMQFFVSDFKRVIK